MKAMMISTAPIVTSTQHETKPKSGSKSKKNDGDGEHLKE